MSDKELFSEIVGQVDKRHVSDRADVRKATGDPLAQAARRKAALQEVSAGSDPLSGDNEGDIPPVDPEDILDFKRGGVQHGVYRNLRLGKYAIDARIDLHKLRVPEARQAVYQFIEDCVANDIRCGLITHGKGHGREQPALLKSCVNHWLPQLEQVLAFHSAQKQHGGSGAVYVLLKKSERKKQATREQLFRR